VREGDLPLLSLCKNVSLWGAACNTGAVVKGVAPVTLQASPHNGTRLLLLNNFKNKFPLLLTFHNYCVKKSNEKFREKFYFHLFVLFNKFLAAPLEMSTMYALHVPYGSPTRKSKSIMMLTNKNVYISEIIKFIIYVY